jgi:oxygen-dependent protoporphyrinogen oxidase
MAGLAAAWEAERQAAATGLDLRVTLLEAGDRLGGKVATVREDGFVVEGGADAIVRYKPWALELAREVGLGDEVVETLAAAPAALVVVGGRAHPLPAGLNVALPSRPWALARSPLLSSAGKLRALGDLVLPRGDADDEPFGAFVTRRFGRELWGRLAAPLVGGIYGSDPWGLSTEATFPQLRELERRHRSVLLGSRRALRVRAAGEGGSLFVSLAGGLGRLADAVAGRLARTEIRLGEPVRRLEELAADAVILAVPAYAAGEIVEAVAPDAAAALAGIPYAGAVSVTLAFPAEGFPPTAAHGVLYAVGEGGGVRGFTWIDRKWPGRAPEGTRLVRAFLEPALAGRADREVAGTAMGALRSLLGPVPAASRTWVFRWPRALPQYTVGHLERVRRAEAALPAGVFLGGAAFRGIGIPDVVRDGRGAASRAIAHLTAAPLSGPRTPKGGG